MQPRRPATTERQPSTVIDPTTGKPRPSGSMLAIEQEGREHLGRGKKAHAEGDYAGAAREYQAAAESAAGQPVAAEALFLLGLTFADGGNPKKDYARAATYLRRLGNEFPRSFYTDQARVILSLVREHEDLARTVEKLNGIIEESKRVDIGIEERKRGRTR